MSFNKCTVSGIYYHYIITQHSFTPLKTPLCFTYPALLFPQTHGNHWFNALAFFRCHINRMISYVLYLLDYILSLSNVHLRLMYVFHGVVAHFFFSLNNTLLCRCTMGCSLTSEGHLTCFQFSGDSEQSYYQHSHEDICGIIVFQIS